MTKYVFHVENLENVRLHLTQTAKKVYKLQYVGRIICSRWCLTVVDWFDSSLLTKGIIYRHEEGCYLNNNPIYSCIKFWNTIYVYMCVLNFRSLYGELLLYWRWKIVMLIQQKHLDTLLSFCIKLFIHAFSNNHFTLIKQNILY